MSRTATRLGVYGAILAVTFGASYGVGHATDTGNPTASATAEAGLSPTPTPTPTPTSTYIDSGYRLEFSSWIPVADGQVDLPFRIVGPDGGTVTDLATLDGRQLEMVVLAPGHTDFTAVAPTGDGAGTWTVRLAAPRPDPYRLLVHLTPRGSAQIAVFADVVIANGPGGAS